MRIVIIASYARSLINFRGVLIAEFVKHGHEVIACAPEEDPEVTEALGALNVTYRNIPLNRTGMNPVKDALGLARLVVFLRQLKPDVVLGYTIKPVIYGSLAAHLAGVPNVYAMVTGLGYAFGEGDTFKRRLMNTLVTILLRISIRNNQAVFFQNPDDRDFFIQRQLVRGDGQAVLINGSGVDLNHYAPAPPVLDPPTFLLIARLIQEKGIEDYIEAARLIKQKYPQAQFRLLGMYDTNPTAITKEQIATWEQAGLIQYLGVTDDVRPFIAATSVYILPSFYREGTPRSILEALSMARPVITTDKPGCRETVINGHNGFLVPARDSAALAAAIEKFILAPNLITEMASRSREIAESKYDIHKVNRDIISTMKLI